MKPSLKFLVVCHCLCLPIISAHLLPDELLTDDAEQLEREKRDSFFERLFKTFPLFNKHEEEEDQNQKVQDPFSDDINTSYPEFSIPSFDVNFDEMSTPPILSPDRSAMFTSPTVGLKTSTQDVTPHSSMMTKTPVLTLSPSPMFTTFPTTIVVSESTLTTTRAIPSLNISMLSTINSMISTHQLSTSQLQTIQPTAVIHTSLPTATIASSFILLKNSYSIQATPSQSPSLYTVNNLEGPLFDVKVLLAEPRLPDEKGYADVLAQNPPNRDDHEVKGIHFLFSNLLIPIMSGLFGALCITIIILVTKCIRRRKLRKIRYYGGKPESRLYGLDHMGLLSDMSSDEE